MPSVSWSLCGFWIALTSVGASGTGPWSADQFETEADALLTRFVREGAVDYEAAAADPTALLEWVQQLESADPSQFSMDSNRKAFWINAYNLSAIAAIVEAWPVSSPRQIPGFFDRQSHRIAGESLTLDRLESEKLRGIFGDARIHFALVCAAQGCPEIQPWAFRSRNLESQLDQRTRSVINDDHHVRRVGDVLEISSIFAWYSEDFEADAGSVHDYLNRYSRQTFPTDLPIVHLKYDWSLNLANTARDLGDYTPSTLLLPGEFEIKLFNNFYTQTAFFEEDGSREDQDHRSSYHTSDLSLLWGWTHHFSIGGDAFIKAVLLSGEPSQSRVALTALAPKMKWAPPISGMAVQWTLVVPVASDLEGGADTGEPFLDYDDVQLWQQAMYDHWITEEFLAFVEVGALIRFDNENDVAFTTPFKVLPHWYASDALTFYAPFEWAPSWGDGGVSSFYTQVGLGAKLRLQPGLELEALYTKFPIGKSSGAGQTFNLGLRWLR